MVDQVTWLLATLNWLMTWAVKMPKLNMCWVERLSNRATWFFQPHFRLPFQPVRYYRMVLYSVLGPSSIKPCASSSVNSMTASGLHSFLFFESALNSKLSGGPPESRRVAENGSNRDSSEAVRSGSDGPERLGERRDRRSVFLCLEVSCPNNHCRHQSDPPGYCQIANSFSGINATSSFMMQ